MKKIIIGCLSCCFIIILGCTKHIAVTEVCAKQFEQCRQTCEDNCPNCMKKSICAATKSYNRSGREQKVQGGMIILELKSYRDPLQCRKISCNCMADLNVCMQGKSGIIHKRMQVNTACER